MHFVKSSCIQNGDKMSEGLVNIELPWHIPECTYQQRASVYERLGVAAAVTWSHMVVNNSSFRCELKWRTALRPSQLWRTIKV